MRAFLHITGSLEIGVPGGEIFDGTLASCRIHDLPHEILTSQQISQRFPAYRLPQQYAGVLQPDGGFLDPEGCIAAHLTLARAHGAAIHTDEQIVDWEPAGDGVRVRTDQATYSAERLVITAGAWLPKLVPPLARLAVPERQVLAWFRPQRPEHFAAEAFPVFILAVEEGNFYGFPMYGLPGLKIGLHHHLAGGGRSGDHGPHGKRAATRQFCANARHAIFPTARARHWRSRPVCTPTRRTATSLSTATPNMRRS